VRHRLSCAGNRRVNHALHMAAAVQLRHETEGKAYWRRKNNGPGKALHAMRCLKRRISDTVYRQLVTDATARQDAQTQQGQQEVAAGRVGHPGASLASSAADLPPDIGTSDQPQPELGAVMDVSATDKSPPPRTGCMHSPTPTGERWTPFTRISTRSIGSREESS
jgi:transposase